MSVTEMLEVRFELPLARATFNGKYSSKIWTRYYFLQI